MKERKEKNLSEYLREVLSAPPQERKDLTAAAKSLIYISKSVRRTASNIAGNTNQIKNQFARAFAETKMNEIRGLVDTNLAELRQLTKMSEKNLAIGFEILGSEMNKRDFDNISREFWS
ncbi:MAG: hypothetical protein LBU73_06655 [Helicobacteraceae bacterium]|nr:hypothetical protein [Helicobacteraceae bacterium]